MKRRKAIALLVLAATVAGCTSPEFATRAVGFHHGIDLVSLTAVSGIYR